VTLPERPLPKSKVPHGKNCAVLFKFRILILKFVYYISLRNRQNVSSGEAGENIYLFLAISLKK